MSEKLTSIPSPKNTLFIRSADQRQLAFLVSTWAMPTETKLRMLKLTHSILWQCGIFFEKTTNFKTFVDDLSSHISNMSAVGIIIAPTNANIKESLFVETILSELPSQFDTTILEWWI
ncbi:hypothetical protein VP01_176g2 [Puccinia sorghi]|uniref:Uncharacterized protein n=1 Tax=Puccinia sorghi TaxID=27349 RepID=A0A0L6VER6_9BASI|nr:hypothetical protein VP01_176g2 [Puccinia sorghi]